MVKTPWALPGLSLWLAVGAMFVWVSIAQSAHTHARLALSVQTVKAGSTILGGVHMKMDKGWHTYWRNPGASGMATTVDWKLPPGIKAGDIQWPVPEKLFADDLTTYVYHDEVVLLVPLTFNADWKPGKITIKASVAWLECEVMCLPGNQDVEQAIQIGPEAERSRDADLIAAWQKRLPLDGTEIGAAAKWEAAGPKAKDLRPVLIEWRSPFAAEPDFLPYANESFEVQPATELVGSESGVVRLRKLVKKMSGDWPNEIHGLVVNGKGAERVAYEARLTPGEAGLGDAAQATSPGSSPARLWKMLLYAFIGGLILNIMPCVLPVIALKILGFVGQARDHPSTVRRLGLIYGLGVLVSFLVLASLVIAVKAAGHQAGWGMQFGNPLFLVGLTVLVTLVAFNLFGLFEITPGARVMDTAGQLASKHGPAGAFFNGVLATILATPCTAPFLGVALGFAFTQSAAVILLVFAAVAGGLAAPYVILSWHPAWLKFLPKPGLWMERFKVLMGFPMLATAIWLYSLTQTFYGPRTWWLALFLVMLGLSAWAFGEFVQRGKTRRGLAGAVIAVILVVGYLGIVEGQLQWREPLAEEHTAGTVRAAAEGIDWKPWSAEAVAAARKEGRPVLVDFTADWCLTCQANKRFALEVPQVRARLKEMDVVALKGDYTRFPPAITEELRRFGRAGVPLVLIYPKDASSPPIVLPEALTSGIVLRELDKAADGRSSRLKVGKLKVGVRAK